MANRTTVMPGVWANDAQTVIPVPPVSNTSYRNNSLTEQTINNGWGYSTIVNSADYNQFMYLLTQFLKTVENSGGVLPFCTATTYNKNGYAIGSDNLLYVSQKDDNIGNDPTEDDGTNWKTFEQMYLSNFVDKTSDQTISGSKHFTKPAEGMSIELVADTNQQTVPAEPTVRLLGLYRNATHTKGDGYTSWLKAVRTSDGWTATELYTRRLLESDSQEIINYIKVRISPEGIPISYTKTPPVGVTSEEIITAGWFDSKIQVVSTLPENPDPNVFYFIPE